MMPIHTKRGDNKYRNYGTRAGSRSFSIYPTQNIPDHRPAGRLISF